MCAPASSRVRRAKPILNRVDSSTRIIAYRIVQALIPVAAHTNPCERGALVSNHDSVTRCGRAAS